MSGQTKRPKVSIMMPKGRPYQIRYQDPSTSEDVRISVGSRSEADAKKLKAEVEAKLLLGDEPRQPTKQSRGANMFWEVFRQEFSRLKLATQRDGTADSSENRLDVCERIIKPRTLGDMASPNALERLKAELLIGTEGRRGKTKQRKQRRSPHTVNSYLACLVSALNWAHKQGYLEKRTPKQEVAAVDPEKGRPLTDEEFDAYLDSVNELFKDPKAANEWKYFLRGLRASGLRIGEAMNLSWDIPGTITPVQLKRSIALRIPGKQQKNRRHEEIPATPDLVELLEKHPSRKGWVFNPPKRRGVGRPSTKTVKCIISELGQLSGIVVKEETGKHASAHDLRRTFGQRLADAGVRPRDLQRIMRHSSLETTEAYYLRDDVDEMGSRFAEQLQHLRSN